MKKIDELLSLHTHNSPDLHKHFPRLSQLKSFFLKNCLKTRLLVWFIEFITHW
jgi:hypothetical protein